MLLNRNIQQCTVPGEYNYMSVGFDMGTFYKVFKNNEVVVKFKYYVRSHFLSEFCEDKDNELNLQ